MRYVEGATYTSIGEAHGYSSTRADQRVKGSFHQAKRWVQRMAQERVSSLLSALQERDGIMPAVEVEALTSDDVRRVLLALYIAGEKSWSIWRGQYLTRFKPGETRRRVEER